MALAYGKRLRLLRMAASGLLLSGFVMAAPESAAAQDVEASEVPQQINLYDVVLTYPQPTWVSGRMDHSELLGQSEFFEQQTGPQFILEQIPAGQTFARWKRLYAVVAEELGAGQAVPMGTFVRLTVEVNQEACSRTGFAIQPINVSETDAVLLVVCGSTENGPVDVGYGPDVGEVSIWRFMVYENTYVKLYHRWRGAAFVIDDRADWPVTVSELNAMVRRMIDDVGIVPNESRR